MDLLLLATEDPEYYPLLRVGGGLLMALFWAWVFTKARESRD